MLLVYVCLARIWWRHGYWRYNFNKWASDLIFSPNILIWTTYPPVYNFPYYIVYNIYLSAFKIVLDLSSHPIFAPKRPVPKRLCAKTGRRQTGRAKTSWSEENSFRELQNVPGGHPGQQTQIWREYVPDSRRATEKARCCLTDALQQGTRSPCTLR